MMRVAIRCIALTLAVSVVPCWAEEPKEKPSHKFVGTWKSDYVRSPLELVVRFPAIMDQDLHR